MSKLTPEEKIANAKALKIKKEAENLAKKQKKEAEAVAKKIAKENILAIKKSVKAKKDADRLVEIEVKKQKDIIEKARRDQEVAKKQELKLSKQSSVPLKAKEAGKSQIIPVLEKEGIYKNWFNYSYEYEDENDDIENEDEEKFTWPEESKGSVSSSSSRNLQGSWPSDNLTGGEMGFSMTDAGNLAASFGITIPPVVAKLVGIPVTAVQVPASQPSIPATPTVTTTNVVNEFMDPALKANLVLGGKVLGGLLATLIGVKILGVTVSMMFPPKRA